MVNVGRYKIDGDNVIKKLRHHFHFDNCHFSGQQDKPCCGGEKKKPILVNHVSSSFHLKARFIDLSNSFDKDVS
jgi:hypothetical protein